MNVGALNVTLGLLVDKASWKKGDARIDHFRRIGTAVTAIFAGRALGSALIGFNMKVEDAKNQIASMLSFAKKTSLTDELGNADKMYDSLRAKAAELPGSTQDYVQMLGMITQPLAAAGASLEQMEQFTVNSFVLSKGLGENWQKSARDIREFVNFGKLNAVDTFSRTVLKNVKRHDGKKGGYDAVDKDRAYLKSLTDKQRVALFEEGIGSKQVQEMIERQANSMSGRVDRFKDAIAQTLGKVGEGLFLALKDTLKDIGDWLDNNRERIKAWADAVGAVLATVFNAMRAGFGWLMDHEDILVSFLVMIGAMFAKMAILAIGSWLAIAWPMFAGAGLFYMFTKLYKHLGALPTILIAVGAAGLIMWLGVGGPVVPALILLAAFAAALYVWKDEVVAIFEAVKNAAGDVWDVMNKIPLISNMIGVGKTIAGIATGDAGAAGRGVEQMFLGPAAGAFDVTGGAYRTPERDMSGSNAVSINAPTTVNITGVKDAAEAKDSFAGTSEDAMAAALRKAKRNVK